MVNPGDFNSLPLNGYDKEMLSDAYNTVTALSLWDWLKQDSIPGEGGFMFSQASEVQKISDTMKYTGHSGASFGYVMRIMEVIAKNGWDVYAKEVNNSVCPCHRAQNKTGWCGVAGGGVPACDH